MRKEVWLGLQAYALDRHIQILALRSGVCPSKQFSFAHFDDFPGYPWMIDLCTPFAIFSSRIPMRNYKNVEFKTSYSSCACPLYLPAGLYKQTRY